MLCSLRERVLVKASENLLYIKCMQTCFHVDSLDLVCLATMATMGAVCCLEAKREGLTVTCSRNEQN
jgi:hypothetical protein